MMCNFTVFLTDMLFISLLDTACIFVPQSRLLVQDCAAKLEAFGLQGAIQEVSMIKVRWRFEFLAPTSHTSIDLALPLGLMCPTTIHPSILHTAYCRWHHVQL